MSTYWGYVCLDHDPHLASERWFNHGEDLLWDAWSRERAGVWPHRPYGSLPPEDCEPKEVLGAFGTTAPIWWLREHPSCNVALRNEYGDIARLPRRVQLSRRKGWRKPENTVVVARPSKWGNPFTIDGAIAAGYSENREDGREIAAGAFRDWMHGNTWAAGSGPEWESRRLRMLAELAELAGKNLACWCPLDQPCHADVLLELANGGAS